MTTLRCGECKYNFPKKGIEFNGVPRNMCGYEPERRIEGISQDSIGKEVTTTDDTNCLYGLTLETLNTAKGHMSLIGNLILYGKI